MNTNVYASIIVDGHRLLFPEIEVRETLPIGEVRSNSSEPESLFVETRDQQCPVYIIDGQLAPLRSIPVQRQLAVCFAAGGRLFGLACDAIATVQFGSDYLFEELPEMMRLPGSPLLALLYTDGHLHYVTAADSLLHFLTSQER